MRFQIFELSKLKLKIFHYLKIIKLKKQYCINYFFRHNIAYFYNHTFRQPMYPIKYFFKVIHRILIYEEEKDDFFTGQLQVPPVVVQTNPTAFEIILLVIFFGSV